uniref:Secreted protein n=1 Tax=Achlya hypogyna TaxID=1202772 RepID=A0A0A7CNW4_ACHHY|nr:secreted protein [Achlya hypogyna]
MCRGISLLALLSAALAAPTTDAPFWGRIYLRDGLLPIQYFKDSYGGDIFPAEHEFVLPTNNLACTPFDDSDVVRITNATAAIVVVDRGECSFETKSKHAQDAGATGVIIVSTTEEAVRPVAHVAKGEIRIPTVMVRHSAGTTAPVLTDSYRGLLGDLIRAAAAREAVYGKLVPMVCPKSICGPAMETDTIFMHTVRGGVLSLEDGTTFDFLAASFGGPLIKRPLTVAVAAPSHACTPLTNAAEVEGKAVLVQLDDAAGSNCSFLAKVSEAQVAGASAVILVQRSHVAVVSPAVEEAWTAYNITIPTVMVTHTTGSVLELRPADEVRLESDDRVVDAWDVIHSLVDLTNWPSKKSRRESFLSDIIDTHGTTPERRDAIRASFIRIVGGTPAAWDRLTSKARDEL